MYPSCPIVTSLGSAYLHTQGSLARDHTTRWNSCFDLQCVCFGCWVMTSVLHLNQVIQQSNRKHTYAHSFKLHCTCQLRNNKNHKKCLVELNEPISHWLSVSFHGIPTLVVKLKRPWSVITQASEDILHSPLEHSRGGADSRPHLCHWLVQLGLVQRSLTELL